MSQPKSPNGNPWAGEIRDFDKRLPSLLDWARLLCEADEMQRAMHLLTDGLPGYYRHHVPKEVIDLRKQIMTQFMTTYDYVVNPEDDTYDAEHSRGAIDGTLRGQEVQKLVQEYNGRGINPHVIDMGPGDYWLPCGLDRKGLKFTYEPIGLQSSALAKFKKDRGHLLSASTPTDRPVIFIACEIIEHLWNPYEIAQTMHKTGIDPEHIVMSTPLFTFGWGNQDFFEAKKRGVVGHLKTFTPQEFLDAGMKMFPEYDLNLIVSEIMLLRGIRKNGNISVSNG